MYRIGVFLLALLFGISHVEAREQIRTIGTQLFEAVSDDEPPTLLDLIVIGVACGSSAAAAGLEIGDSIIEINGHEILQKEISAYLRAAHEVESTEKAVLKVKRPSGIVRTVTLVPTLHDDEFKCGKPLQDS